MEQVLGYCYQACYNKCIKSFFNYHRFDSVTDMLSELNLPKFDVLFNNYTFANSTSDGSHVLMVLSDILSFIRSFSF